MLNPDDVKLLKAVERDLELGEMGKYSFEEIGRAHDLLNNALDVLIELKNHVASSKLLIDHINRLRNLLVNRKSE